MDNNLCISPFYFLINFLGDNKLIKLANTTIIILYSIYLLLGFCDKFIGR